MTNQTPTQSLQNQLSSATNQSLTNLQSQSKHTISLSLLSLPINKIPYKTSIHKSQLKNHIMRKQLQQSHKKTISQFYSKKKQLNKIVKINKLIENRKKLLQNRLEQYINNSNKNIKSMEDRKHYSTLSKQLRKNTQYAILTNLPNNQYKTNSHRYSISHNYTHSTYNPSDTHLHNNIHINKNINKRQVYLSNITNLQQLKQSFSYSRAKFNRKIIKMDKEIGRYYYPYQDRLLGDQNGIKGIFL